ncbi:MAG: HAMP domain-containing protein [Myxococcales bacterium]|nr:HAMP domain-containing protein [Myxococcales bacterium]
MRSLFAQFYAALGVGHAMGVVVWAVAAAATVPVVAEQHLASVLEGPTVAMVERLREAPAADRDAVLSSWSGTPARLVPPLPLQRAGAVRDGALVIELSYPNAHAYRAVDPHTWLALGPMPMVPAGFGLRWGALALLATVGIGLGAWVALRPVRRTLDRVAVVARAFGAGDLDARARVQGPQELEEVGEAFDAMADRIHALLRAQQETLQAVSHELRTPLTRARFALELVADTDDVAHRRAQAEDAAGDLEQMERLLDELLAYLRLESVRELARQPTPLQDLAQAVSAQRVPVEVRGQAMATVDPRLMQRALRNLVANAARYAASIVHISVDADAAGARIVVDDDGPGIPEEERARLLEPFRRGGGAGQLDPGGFGLGLPIAARVARAHGGRLEVGQSPLGGARMVLFVP